MQICVTPTSRPPLGEAPQACAMLDAISCFDKERKLRKVKRQSLMFSSSKRMSSGLPSYKHKVCDTCG